MSFGSSYKAWASKQKGNPQMLVVTFVGFTIGAYLLHKTVYKPYKRQKILEEAEAYAQHIYDLETKKM